MKKWSLFLLLCLLFVPGVFAAGTCELDKYDYIQAETAFFSCSCTLSNEENVAGNIVWRNSTNHILQSTSTNSGNCKDNIFEDTYFFPSGQNFSGNVTFNTTSANWAGIGDVVSDTFNVSGASAIDCLIYNITTNEPVPGDIAVVKFHIKEGSTLNDLLDVKCSMSVYNIDGQPIYVHEDEISGDHYEVSTTTGEVYFHHELSESLWESNHTLEAEFHCSCLNNGNDSSTICYDETDGSVVGYKVCTATSPLQLSSGDNRIYSTSWGLAVLIVGILFFLLLLANTFKDSTKWFHQSVRLLLILLSVWVLIIGGSLGISFANSGGASDTTIATMQAFYKLTVYFGWVFTFLLLLYFFYEVMMAFRIDKERKEEEILGK
ncbi:hypothetical protein ES702_04942 [subsurface metagenome]